MEAESGDVSLAPYRLASVGGAKRVRCIREEQRPPELSLDVILGLKLGANGCGAEQSVDGMVIDGPAPKSTGMTTLVRGPCARVWHRPKRPAAWGRCRPLQASHRSAKQCWLIAPYVMAGMMTSSPGPTPNQRNANSHAVVQLKNKPRAAPLKTTPAPLQTPPTLDQM